MNKKTKLLLIICITVFILLGAVLLLLLLPKKRDTPIESSDTVEDVIELATDTAKDGPETTSPLREGAVVAIKDLHFRVDGKLREQPDEYSTIIIYYDEDDISHTLQYVSVADTVDIKAVIVDFIDGNYAKYKELLGIIDTDACTCYTYEILGQTVTLLYDETQYLYYSIIPIGDEYLVISADTEFYLTEDRITTVLGDPAKMPMVKHTYNVYETSAITNTKALLQESSVGFVATGNNSSTTASSSVVTYTSADDDETRAQMAKYASYKWEPDGTSKDTKLSLDLTSAIAKSSQWILSAESVYSWSDNGLKLSGLQATKSSVQFTLKGTVTNLLATERPWVLVIKLLDQNGSLLKVEVVDSRSIPLAGNGDTEFSILTTTSEGIDVNEIKSVQFDIY